MTSQTVISVNQHLMVVRNVQLVMVPLTETAAPVVCIY